MLITNYTFYNKTPVKKENFMSIIKRNQIDSFKVDGETTINRYNYSTDTYDIVEGVFNDSHGIVLNKTSL